MASWTLALQVYLQAADKIVNVTNAFIYGDCPDPDCNCCLHVTNCLGLLSHTRTFR